MDVERITKVYIAIRDKRAELKKKFTEEDDQLKEKQETLGNTLLKFLHESNLDSTKTSMGTVYRQEEVKTGCSDWDALWTWAKENDAMDIFERRVKTAFVKEYAETHEGGLPPGISVFREYVARVRRS